MLGCTAGHHVAESNFGAKARAAGVEAALISEAEMRLRRDPQEAYAK